MIALIVFGLVATLASGAAAETRPEYGGIVVSSLLEEPLRVDPIAARSHTDTKVAGLIFDTLYREAGGVVVPHLASDMPDVTDPRRVRVPLRARVFFHNGKVMKASDVADSLRRVKKSPIGHILANVVTITVDEGDLVIELRVADAKLAARLSSPHTAVTFKGRAPNWRRLVGSGPYQFKERSTRKKELRLVAHPKHFAGRAYADEIRLRWFDIKSAESRSYETGASQISMRGDIAFAGHRPKYKTNKKEVEANILVYLGFGKSSALLAESQFRHALAAAIGRAGMKHIGSGEPVVPTLSPLPRSARGTVISSAGMAANGAKSKKLLNSLGTNYKSLKNNSLLLDIIVNKSRPDDAIVAGRVAAALFAVGIQSRLVTLSASAFQTRVASGQCDLFIGQLATPGTMPVNTLRTAFVAGGAGGALPALAKKGRTALEREFAAQLPLIPLFHRGLRVDYRSDLLSLEFDSSARLRYEDLFFFGKPEKN